MIGLGANRHGAHRQPPAPQPTDVPTHEELIEALLWMTGSDHFSPGRMAHEGFQKIVAPVLARLSRKEPSNPGRYVPGRSCRHGINPDECEFCDSPGAEKEEATRQALSRKEPSDE